MLLWGALGLVSDLFVYGDRWGERKEHRVWAHWPLCSGDSTSRYFEVNASTWTEQTSKTRWTQRLMSWAEPAVDCVTADLFPLLSYLTLLSVSLYSPIHLSAGLYSLAARGCAHLSMFLIFILYVYLHLSASVFYVHQWTRLYALASVLFMYVCGCTTTCLNVHFCLRTQVKHVWQMLIIKTFMFPDQTWCIEWHASRL